ncbi:MAG: hypothetical protein ABIT16_03105 [Croceibacterium sp.]
MSDKDGTAIDAPLHILGRKKGEGGLTIILAAGGGIDPRGCVIVAPLGGATHFSTVLDTFTREFGASRQTRGNFAFKVGPDLALLAATGTSSAPAARVIVMEFGESK